jgi:DNA-binding transcriptional MerR regulator
MSNSSEENGIYTPRDFARTIGVSQSTLKNWERKGLLKARRYPSGRRFYTQEQLNTILETDTNESPTEE